MSMWQDIAQYFMDNVQSNCVTASVDGGFIRNAPPYFACGDMKFTNIPGQRTADGSCVRWIKRRADWKYVEQMGGQFEDGSMGSLLTTFQVKVLGSTENVMQRELIFLIQGIQTAECYPPINDIEIEFLDQDETADNAFKEVALVTFSAPIKLDKPALTTAVTILTASLTSSLASGSLETPHPYLSRFTTLTSASLGHGILS